MQVFVLCADDAFSGCHLCHQVQEASLGQELLAAQAAMAASQQQQQQEQQQMMSQLQVLQEESSSLKQQLQKAQVESELAAAALVQAQGMLRKLLVQVTKSTVGLLM